MIWLPIFLFCFATSSFARTFSKDGDLFSNSQLEKAVHSRGTPLQESKIVAREIEAAYWKSSASESILSKVNEQLNTGKAKNIIMFLGDGMSLPTLTASRIYKGQKEGNAGEEQQLSFENFPYNGLSKTYCVDAQVTDSAASATAYLTGVKTNYNTVGVTAAVAARNCTAMLNENNHVSSIAEWAQNAGMRTGFVTTARVTHASPAPLYAHTAFREWESDTDALEDGIDPTVCVDIASQLIYNGAGQKLNVIFGGGKAKFLPNDTTDESGNYGSRSDGRNLIETWRNLKAASNSSYAYVYNREGLQNLTNEDYTLGLFTPTHMHYELDRDTNYEPSIAEMTEAAIKILSKGDKGFFLFVEGARIDMAHHDLLAMKALEETVAFADAVTVAVNLTNSDETLILVTADHAHTMSFSGYPSRGSNILKTADRSGDGLPYLILSYANGKYNGWVNGTRHNVSSDEDLGTKDYVYPGMVYRSSESHGGDDVGIYAKGPWAHLVRGVNEQNVIPYIMAYAACIGDGPTVCSTTSSSSSSVNGHFYYLLIIITSVISIKGLNN